MPFESAYIKLLLSRDTSESRERGLQYITDLFPRISAVEHVVQRVDGRLEDGVHEEGAEVAAVARCDQEGKQEPYADHTPLYYIVRIYIFFYQTRFRFVHHQYEI